MGEIIAEQPALLVFLRHFGCAGCAQQVDALLPFVSQLRQLGVQIVLLGSGRPNFVAEFSRRHRLDGYSLQLLSDPTLQVFEEALLPRSFWRTYGPGALASALGAWGQGYASRSLRGDRFQQGGVVVVDKATVVSFAATPTLATGIVSMPRVVAEVVRVAGGMAGVA